MREIKFRAWDKTTNEMVLPEKLWASPVDTHEWDNIVSINIFFNRNTDWQFMQFTGLKDKNGKEIYEGDLFGKYGGDVEKPNEYEIHARVYFDNDIAAFCVDDQRGGWDYLIVYLLDPKNQKEVIGNCFENPELLTNEK